MDRGQNKLTAYTIPAHIMQHKWTC